MRRRSRIGHGTTSISSPAPSTPSVARPAPAGSVLSSSVSSLTNQPSERRKRRGETVDGPPIALLDLVAQGPRVHPRDVATLHDERLTGERAVGGGQIRDERRDVGGIPQVERALLGRHDVLADRASRA